MFPESAPLAAAAGRGPGAPERLRQAEAALRRAEEALERGIAEIHTPEQAEAVIAELERLLGALSEEQVAAATPAASLPEQAAAIARAGAGADSVTKPANVIAEAAAQIAAAPPERRAVLDQAVARATGHLGDAPLPPAQVRRSRALLRSALFRRLKPFDAADSDLFLAINHLPHPRSFDTLMRGWTDVMNGGHGWLLVLLAGIIKNPRYGWRAARGVAPALWLATWTVEYPIKKFFRRRRPFISLVRAIVVGRKPGNYSFPSGHSAAAFAGATLLAGFYPRARPVLMTLATLTAFSRVYLGAHYPGDVVTGSLLGTFLARGFRRALGRCCPSLGGR